MENVNHFNNDEQLQLSEEIIFDLDKSRKWARIIGIVGMITVGFYVILAFLIPSLFSSIPMPQNELQFNPMSMMGFIYTPLFLLAAAVYFFPSLFLLRFASKLQNAFQFRNQLDLNFAIKQKRYFFQYIGVLAIITGILLLLYILFFVAFFSFFSEIFKNMPIQ
jgi:protein-S-isoprenylcysteine O-methyltransferase Ste14